MALFQGASEGEDSNSDDAEKGEPQEEPEAEEDPADLHQQPGQEAGGVQALEGSSGEESDDSEEGERGQNPTGEAEEEEVHFPDTTIDLSHLQLQR